MNHLLSSAYLLSQAELRKPFPEISLDRISSSFETIIADFSDFSKQQEKAQEALNLVKEAYLQKKIAFLESQVHNPAGQWDSNSVSISDKIKSYQSRLAELAAELREEMPSSSSQASSDSSIMAEASSATSSETIADIEIISLSTNVSSSATSTSIALTDKMRVWEPIEESIYRSWVLSHEASTMEDFYMDESDRSPVLSGILESYSQSVKNKPGDYILRINNTPVAYLYSTKVNLDKLIGQRVSIKAAPRPNNNFAFPAYHVITVE